MNLLIVDYNNIAFILDKGGELNLEGYNRYIRDLARQVKADKVITVADCSNKNYFRKEPYPEYKAHRKIDDKDKPRIERFIKAKYEIKPYSEVGLEADDLIGSLVRNHKTGKVFVVSSDSDFVQFGMFKNFMRLNPLKKRVMKHTAREAIESLTTKILKGDRKDNIFKSHLLKRIMKNDLTPVFKKIISGILFAKKTLGVTKIEEIPLRAIIKGELERKFEMDEEVYNLNFDLLNLIQPVFETYTSYTDRGIYKNLLRQAKTP
jgi:hypothetical protein